MYCIIAKLQEDETDYRAVFFFGNLQWASGPNKLIMKSLQNSKAKWPNPNMTYFHAKPRCYKKNLI